MLTLISLAYLGWIGTLVFVKKDVPQWMHRLYDRKSWSSASWTVNGLHILLLSLIFVFLFSLFSEMFGNAGNAINVVLLPTAIIGLFLLFHAGKLLQGKYRYYYRERPFIEKLEAQRKKEKDDYDRIERNVIEQQQTGNWATVKELNAVLPQNADESSLIVTGQLLNRFDKKGHIITIGPARAGKGSSVIIPPMLDKNLKRDRAPSVVFLDPRGENLAVIGKQLEEMGYKVIVLNPYDIPEIATFKKGNFNPFDLFNSDSKDFNKYVDLIRFAIIPPDEVKGHNSYFKDAASDLLSLYIRHMMTQDKEPKNITTLYRWLRRGPEERIELLGDMEQNDRFEVSYDSKAILSQLISNTRGGGVHDVYANLTTYTGIFKDQQIRDCMASSDFTLEEIARDKVALFICLGAEDLERMNAWLRIVLSSIMRGFTRNYNLDRKVFMILDEFASLGTVSEFNNVQLLANYGITVWTIIQDLNQIRSLYPHKWEGFINNTIVRHWISIGDNFTADYLAKRMPDVVHFGDPIEGKPQYHVKKLLTAAEIQRFPDIILEVNDLSGPFRYEKKPYWDYLDGFSPNPFYRK